MYLNKSANIFGIKIVDDVGGGSHTAKESDCRWRFFKRTGGLTVLQVTPAGNCNASYVAHTLPNPAVPVLVFITRSFATRRVNRCRLWDEQVLDPDCRVGPIFLPYRSNMSVPFTIDGEEESIQINVGRSDLQLLKDTSPILRELIDGYDPHHRQPIQLFENKDEHVDITSIRYLLESIGLEAERQRTKQRITPQEEKKLKLKTANLSQQCNALHYLRCNPSPFLGLWDRQMQPWVSMPQPDRVWSWRIPGRDIREKLKTWPDYPGHSANAAYVLQKDDEFSDALRFLVWDSVMDAVPTAVQGLKDTGGTPHPNN